MFNDNSNWARCTGCNALDVDEFADGSAQCANCGNDPTRFRDLPVQGADEDELIYPVLIWSWAPCQTCGSAEGETGGAEDDICTECGAPLLPIKRRACAEGFPVDAPTGSATDEPVPHRFVVGERGVCTGGKGVQLVGGGPFTQIQVIDIRTNGNLDVAGTADGTIWMGVPHHAVLHLA